MCFSATASFSAAIVLTTIGVVSITKTKHKSQLLFASIPFIFGVQQFAEGILWLTIPQGNYYVLQKLATYIYLFFAHILWPLYVPIAIIALQKSESRTIIQKFLVIVGITISFYLAYCLAMYDVTARIENQHINYKLDYSDLVSNFWIFLYASATIISPFFSKIKRMWILGFTILISYLLTNYFYENYILSVWCFFSSIISIMVYYFILTINNSKKKSKYYYYML